MLVRRRSARFGLTLIEVMIALGVTIALLGSMFAFVFDLLSSRSRARDFAAKQHAATTLIERLEADLASCITADAVAGAGVRGDATSLVILTRGMAVHLAPRGVHEPMVLADLTEATYAFSASSREVTTARRVVGDHTSGEWGGQHTLGELLGKVRFRYHDGSRWRDRFDSAAAGRLPAAIEVGIWFEPWPEELMDRRAVNPEASPGTGLGELERLTFDAGAGFDEQAYAMLSDDELRRDPQADRLRVIVVPDAIGAEDEDNESYFAADTEVERGGSS